METVPAPLLEGDWAWACEEEMVRAVKAIVVDAEKKHLECSADMGAEAGSSTSTEKLCHEAAPKPTWEEKIAEAFQIVCEHTWKERLSTIAEILIPEGSHASGYLDIDKLCHVGTDSTIEKEKLPLSLPELKLPLLCHVEAPKPTWEEKVAKAFQIVCEHTCNIGKERLSLCADDPIPQNNGSDKMEDSGELCLIETDSTAEKKEKLPLLERKVDCSLVHISDDEMLSEYDSNDVDFIPTRCFDTGKHSATSAEVLISEDSYANDKVGYSDLDKLCHVDTDSTAEKEKLPLSLPELKQKMDCSPESTWDEEMTKAIQNVCNSIPTCSVNLEKQPITGGPSMECSGSDGIGKMGTDVDAGKEKPEHHSSRSLTWGQLVDLLFIVRRHRICEYEPKWGTLEPFHFCNYNITFFDFKRESNVGRGEPLHKLPSSELDVIMDSVNVISLKVVQSDVGYPINVYGTVIARDEIDYKCVYLFKRCRDDPQVIRSAEDMLTLTGPNRGLAVWDSMFFKVDLKIKDSGMVDKDFSKGLIGHNAARITRKTKRSKLISRLSEVELVSAPVSYAVEATLAVNILDGPFPFRGKLTAWTADNDINHIILYDSEAPGTLTAIRDGPDGRSVVPLSRSLVAVPLNEALMFDIWTVDGDRETGQLEKSDGKHDFMCGPYKVQVTVTWTAGITSTRQTNCKWIRIGGSTFLL